MRRILGDWALLSLRWIMLIGVLTIMASQVMAASLPSEGRREMSRRYYIEGARRLSLGKYDEAYEMMRKAYLTDPDNAPAALETVGLQLSLGRQPEDTLFVSEALEKARGVADANPGDFFSVYEYATIRQHLGDFDEAARVMERFHSIHPENAEGLQALTDIYLDMREFDKSIEALDKYRRIEGEDVKISIRKGGILLAKGDTLGMIQEARRLIATDPMNPQYWTLKGQLEQYVQRNDSAIASYSEAERLSVEGAGGAPKIALAEVYQAMGDSVAYDRKIYEALMADDLSFEVKHDLLAYYLQNQLSKGHDNARGDALFATLTRQYPHEPRLLWLSARYKAAKGDFSGAFEDVEYAVDLDPSNLDFRMEALKFAYFAKDYKAVDRVYAEIEQFFGDVPADFSLTYAQLLAAAGDFRRSIEVYADLLEKNFPALKIDEPLDMSKLDKSTSVEQLTLLTDIYQGAGDAFNSLEGKDEADKHKAFVCYDNVLLLSPDNPLALNNYAYFLVRDGEPSQEDLERALAMSDKAVTADPGNPTYLDTKAWVLYRKGDYASALELIRAAMEKAEEAGEELDTEYYDHAGDILKALGRDEEARKYWQDALEKDPENADIKKKLK